MEDKRIEDKQISDPQSTIQDLLSKIMTTIQVSSTSWARLNGPYGWCANRFFLFSTTFIQVDFHKTTRITAIETQGSEDYKSWVTSYSLKYKQSGNKFVWYKEGHGQKIFQGNNDANGIVRQNLQKPINSRALRVVPSGYIVWPCLRMELYGCEV
ncbi:retinoschisin-like [Oculina patagonica]